MRSLVMFLIVLTLSGCTATMSVSQELGPLQVFVDSIEPGWKVDTNSEWARHRPGYVAGLVGRPNALSRRGVPLFTQTGASWIPPTVWLREELVGTRCAELIVAGLFARRDSNIPFSFGKREVAKQTRELLEARGWSGDDIRNARASCPTDLPELERATRPLGRGLDG